MNIMDIINIPMGYVLRFCSMIMGNQYLLALFVFAVAIEILLLPFGIKQQKNSIKQAKLRPKEMAIRKKYAGRDDTPTKQKMQQEIQELYQKEGYNPMGGCLPLLIQFPILIALYNIVLNPLHYICGLSQDAIAQIGSVVSSFTGKTYDAARNIDLLSDMRNIYETTPHVFSGIEGFTDRIQELSDIPNLFMFGKFNLGEIPQVLFGDFANKWWLLLVPVITFVAYFFSMKLTRKLSFQPMAQDQAMGCSNKVMDLMMPLFSVYIAFIMPAAIGVYWIFKCLIGMVKQVILYYVMPLPKFTDEDYKAAEKEMNVRVDNKAPKNKSGKVVRSLHHIDDEDFADTAAAGKARREALEAQEEAEAKNKKKTSSVLSAAPLKDDAPAEKKEAKAEEKAADDASEKKE